MKHAVPAVTFADDAAQRVAPFLDAGTFARRSKAGTTRVWRALRLAHALRMRRRAAAFSPLVSLPCMLWFTIKSASERNTKRSSCTCTRAASTSPTAPQTRIGTAERKRQRTMLRASSRILLTG